MSKFKCPYCKKEISFKTIRNWIKRFLITIRKTRVKFARSPKYVEVSPFEKLFLYGKVEL